MLTTHLWEYRVVSSVMSLIDPVFTGWRPRYQLLFVEPQFNLPRGTLQRVTSVTYIPAQGTTVKRH